MVTIELYGVPRLRAGVDQIEVEAGSLGDAMRALGEKCPALLRSVVHGSQLQPSYMIALNGLQMTADPQTSLCDGDILVLLAADAGG